ncbi:MAG: di-trans,poly-cis-decaprenylcistransferase [Pseudomonadota bacterium]|jgi:undecaprenyl diphosphate synthase|uniref:Ditrans,polycis-undecaprenyl-diphosphate synthase ((2E,6E)-farnesyl-diphosphate specific) n=1 Tax=Thiothrix fructosivorans TaxID=111770 RepID=A0A8B0SFK2_9GAMM|nr:polyprenyl diphosphate synthase [Thiothrix fructosivorans]MBO0614736.1 di-trans,poly-cis-decaprenylcistransferase [Thiothrix fructosivorans]QTX09555.1 di-trans,poly-cis-decaprenylcistransferase [Thiothrix fructosivorans]
MTNTTSTDAVPRHVAIVMDGNGRWAKARYLPRLMGHHRGVEAARKVIRACSSAGVECLTLFAFSSENWRRPEEEVSGLMSLFMTALERESAALFRHNVRMAFIGDRSEFSASLQDKIQQVEAMTASCTGMRLLIAANYGGRWDILQAVRTLATQIAAGELDAAMLNEPMFGRLLSTAGVPEPDLFIRTGGEKRISNFLMWQLAYAELYFTDVLWPEFDENALSEAFKDFARRQRRFGMTGEQVSGGKHA